MRQSTPAPSQPTVNVADYIGFAWSIARKWSRWQRSLELEELVSVAYMALVVSAETFEPERGLKFTTYAGPRVNGAIKDALRAWTRHSRVTGISPMLVSVEAAVDVASEVAPDWDLIDQAIESLSADRARLARRIIYDGATTRELEQDFPHWTPRTLVNYRAEVRQAITAYIRQAA